MNASLIAAVKRPLRYAYAAIFRYAYVAIFPQASETSLKERAEFAYWKRRYSAEGRQLSNSHYEALYTTVYGLSHADYVGKRVIDIGCGPRGSLEWADMVEQRVGLDPLVPQYLKLGADQHKMEYCAAPSEKIPYPQSHFDIVTCLNALDHVEDFERTVAEIKRVTKNGGLFLLSVEIDHPPTPTEPISLTRDMLRRLEPEFQVKSERYVGTPDDHGLHQAVLAGQPPYQDGKPGIYIAMMERV
ncbi:class I SAM-dependent methyltransferase [Microvirga arabica]|uniref:class I SAM-dependent methyltransferase n=1 Tax=Microvirga arabica TaxID=1128671 RepID=UPI001939B157|nr:class I SAM-dependent methyltransferase [Microvirga arabica]MBM1175457.1 class I SAM-dependent methyltransferase [Microvirga arabica]